MLIMLLIEVKEKVICEYFCVFKLNGLLFIYDVMLNIDDVEGVIVDLCDVIYIIVMLLKKEGWKEFFYYCGFCNVDIYLGDMFLFLLKGLIIDEGVFGVMKIISNVFKLENCEIFIKMFKIFNDLEKKMGFIVVCS